MSDRPDPPGAAAATGPADAARHTLAYHERTKHHPHRYARSLGFLDWATQPDPFRTFAGAPTVELPLLADGLTTPFADLFRPGAVAPRPPELASVAILCELALGLSAWKQSRGQRWALRCNPSSGNLHPTEGYALVPAWPGLEAGLYHYNSRDHALERRCTLRGRAASLLAGALPGGTLLFVLSTIHWREAWKYGERAFRYCQHDAGHAIASVRFAAAALGWAALLLDGPADADLEALLGLDRAEDFSGVDRHDREHPVGALLVGAPPLDPGRLPTPLAELLREGMWAGRPNRLSPAHVAWEAIDAVAAATRKPATTPGAADAPATRTPSPGGHGIPAATLIRRRRSCLALDGRTALPAEAFAAMLDRLLPRPGVPPWDALPWEPLLHVGLLVHRVRGLPPGLYVLERSAAVHDRLRAALRAGSSWDHPPGCPDHLPLFRLAEADLRAVARTVSCHQEIAADGAFSLGMIADFGATIRARGPWWYRRLFWEAGVLGQVLYLEAEVVGVRATGIGCYFDDLFHDLLGLSGESFQDLYHFTVGGPVDDPRLTTLPPYAHLPPARRRVSGR